MIIGRMATPEKCLFSFRLPVHELKEEEQFLQDRLGLMRDDEKGEP
jgi:hypothetical protein